MKTSFQWRLPLFGLMCRCKSLAQLVDLPLPSYRLKKQKTPIEQDSLFILLRPCHNNRCSIITPSSSFPTGWKTTMTNITIKWYKFTRQIQIQTTMTNITNDISSRIKFKYKQLWPILLSNEICSLSKFEYHQRWCYFFASSVIFPEKVGQIIFHISPIFLGFRFLFCPRMTLLWPLWRTKPHRCEGRT